MSDLTKQALLDSFEKLLKTKPFDKITVSDITDDCGLSRQTFYYHFDDIFGMVKWVYSNDAVEEFGNAPSPVNWQSGILSVLRYTLKEKELILGAYHSKHRNDLNAYFMEMSERFISQIIDEREIGVMKPEDKQFLISVYSYAFVGIVTNWISAGLREDPQKLCKKIELFIQSGFDRALMAFRQPGSA